MGETPIQMDIVRSSGIAAVGSPRSLTSRLVVDGKGSYVVLQTPLENYQELYITPAGALANRAAPGGEQPQRAGVYGDNKIRNCALWVRADGKTTVGLAREDISVDYVYDVSVAAGATAVTITPALDPRDPSVTRFGPGPDKAFGPSRVWVKCVPSTSAGLILQDAAGLPWVIWFDAANTLKVTDWATFVQVGLTVTTASLAGGTVGVAYSATLAASGGAPPYTWTLVSGALPAGLALSSAGVISGTPTAPPGTANFTVRVLAGVAVATKTLSIVVA